MRGGTHLTSQRPFGTHNPWKTRRGPHGRGCPQKHPTGHPLGQWRVGPRPEGLPWPLLLRAHRGASPRCSSSLRPLPSMSDAISSWGLCCGLLHPGSPPSPHGLSFLRGLDHPGVPAACTAHLALSLRCPNSLPSGMRMGTPSVLFSAAPATLTSHPAQEGAQWVSPGRVRLHRHPATQGSVLRPGERGTADLGQPDQPPHCKAVSPMRLRRPPWSGG